MALTAEMKSDVLKQLIVQTAQAKILSTLWIDSENLNAAINPMIKPRDIYNLKAQLRRKDLGPLTPIQALMRELDQEDWIYKFQKNATN